MGGNLWRMFVTGFLLTSMAIVLVVGRIGVARPETVVTLDPKINVAAPDESFNVNVTVTNVAELFCYQGNLTFDPAVLNCTSVEEGPFLGTAGGTWWMAPVIDNYNGWIFFGNSLFPFPADGAIGNGTLAIVTFDVLAEGTSPLNFSETTLNTVDEYGVTQPMEHTAEDGVFMYPLRRDVAVTGVSASPLSVTAGETVSIEVTVKNKGDATESFDVTVKYDSTAIETKTATDLAPGGSETLSFRWDTTGVAESDYTITAVATTLPSETETEDNTHSEVVVTVTAPPPSTTIPIGFLGGIIIAAVAVCAAIFLYVRRRRSTRVRSERIK